MRYILTKEEMDNLKGDEKYKRFYNFVFEIIIKDMEKREYYQEEVDYLPFPKTVYMFGENEWFIKKIYDMNYLITKGMIYETKFKRK